MKKKLAVLATGLCLALAAAGCTTSQPAPSPYAEYVTLGEYKDLGLEPISTEVTDEEVENTINSTLEAYGEEEQIMDRAVEDGDTINIDFKGIKDGVAFDGGTAED